METVVERVPGRWWGLAALSLTAVVLGLDITILVTALPTLSARLSATTSQLQWMSAGYTLALAGGMLPAGVLGDRVGRKRVLMSGLVVFGLSSAAASQVTTADALIFWRIVMGVGGAMILPLVFAMLPGLFLEDERQKAVGIAGVGAFIAIPAGPLVAGYLLNHYHWGSIFLINAPVVLAALFMVWRFIPESQNQATQTLDWVGAVLEVVGVVGIVYGIIEEPVAGWTAPRVLAGLVGGSALVVAFVAWELRQRAPLVDLNMFRDPLFSTATVVFIIAGYTMTGLMFVISPYIQVVEGNDAQGTGLRLLPMVATLIVGAISSDFVTKRLGRRPTVAAGLALNGAGVLVLTQLTATSGYGVVALGLAITGLGVALCMIPSLDAILAALPESETGAGTALTRTLQNVGSSFGVAIMGSILNGAYRASLDGHLAGLPAKVQDAARTSVAVAEAVSRHLPPAAGGRLLGDARQAYASGMDSVMLVTGLIMLAGAVLIAIFMPSRRAR